LGLGVAFESSGTNVECSINSKSADRGIPLIDFALNHDLVSHWEIVCSNLGTASQQEKLSREIQNAEVQSRA
jgi:hypothetical protein